MSITLKMRNGDIAIDSQTGKPKLISGPEKAAQDLGEVLLTLLVPERESRSYAAYPRDYGCELPYIKTPIQFNGFLGGPLISKKIEEAVGRLQTSQRQDVRSTADERIEKITNLTVAQQNATDFLFFLEVQLEGGTKIQVQNMDPTSLDHLMTRTSFQDSRKPPRLT